MVSKPVDMKDGITTRCSKAGNQKSNLITYHLYTLWLITRSDLQCVILPHTIFALSTTLSGPLLTTNPYPTIVSTLSRLPHILLWTYLNLLLGDLSNQRLPSSVAQDTLNKPWRVIPSGRLTPISMRRLLILSIPIVLLISHFLGAVRESATIIILLYIYNDLEVGDENNHLRDLMNALALTTFSSGATHVALHNTNFELNAKGNMWLCLTGAMIFFTIATQDLADVEGDAVTGRRTLPIIYGDGTSRKVLGIAVVFFSCVCPYFLGNGVWGWMCAVMVGAGLAGHILVKRSREGDKRSFLGWALWTVLIYCLPLLRNVEALGASLEDWIFSHQTKINIQS